MNIINLRKTYRRENESRRVNDRRSVNYPFESPQWIANIQEHYHTWPKSDRRANARRLGDRRSPDRRQYEHTEQHFSVRKSAKILLTREELKLIEDLYLNDFDN